MTKDEKFDNIFNEPLSDRKRKIPKDWNPPKKKEKESWGEYIERLEQYRKEYLEKHNK